MSDTYTECANTPIEVQQSVGMVCTTAVEPAPVMHLPATGINVAGVGLGIVLVFVGAITLIVARWMRIERFIDPPTTTPDEHDGRYE